MKDKKLSVFILSFYWLLLLGASVFPVSNCFVEPLLTPKWYAVGIMLIAGGLLFLPVILFRLLKCDWQNVYIMIYKLTNIVIFIEATLSVFQFYSIIPHYYGLSVGSFDNAAGLSACLTLTFPLGIVRFKESRVTERILLLIMKSMSVFAVFLYGSRSAFICMSLIVALMLYRQYRYKVLNAFVVVIIAMLFSSLLFKTDSTKGRWFIIERSVEMIKEHPFVGWGHNGFMANYMDIQAKYFNDHPNSPFVRLADNIHHPLNEYLLIAVNYGLLSLLLVVAFMIVIGCYVSSHHFWMVKEGGIIFVSVLLLSLFSYPFAYPLTTIIVMLSLTLIGADIASKICLKQIVVWTSIILFLFLIPLSFRFYNSIESQLTWKKAMNEISRGNRLHAKVMYSMIYPSLKTDYTFLYNYGYELFRMGHYEQALHLAEETEKIIADYDLQLLKGDCYNKLGERKKAIGSYNKAANMCPSRLVPLYEIYKIYSKHHDSTNCKRIRKLIMKKPIKRMNMDVLKMLNEINKDYRKLNNNIYN